MALRDLAKRLKDYLQPAASYIFGGPSASTSAIYNQPKVQEFFRPQTGTLATKGRQLLQTPLPQRYQAPAQSFVSTVDKIEASPVGIPSRFIQGRGNETARLAIESAQDISQGRYLPGIAKGVGAGLSLRPVGIGAGLFSGGIGALTAPKGTDRARAAGRATSYASIAGSVANATNPYISQAINKIAPGKGTLATRITPAVANVLQGIGIDVSAGQPITPTGVGIDAVTGLLGGRGQFQTVGKGFNVKKNYGTAFEGNKLGKIETAIDSWIENRGGRNKIDRNTIETISNAWGDIYGSNKKKPGLEQMFTDVFSAYRGYNIEQNMKSHGIKLGIVDEKAKGLTPEVTTQLPKTPKLETPITRVVPEPKTVSQQTFPELPKTIETLQTGRTKPVESFEPIIQEAKKQIGKTPEPKGQTFKQSMDNLYTQWVDRYNPIVKASKTAKEWLKGKGAELRPEYDPEYLVRRLTGSGGIADYRFRTELDPIIKQAEKLNIDKGDLDVYLANKRIAGFGQAGRDIYGADPKKASQVVSALEAKYGQDIKNISDQLYSYQNKGFQEMIDSGFISPENAKVIQSQNPDYSPLYRVMDEVDDYLGLPTRKTMQGTQPIAKIKGSTRQIESPVESIIGNTFRQRAAIEKNRVAQSIVGLQDITDLGFKKVSKSSPETITIWNNGKKEYWNVGKDIADVAKGANEEQMNLVLKVLQAPASLLRQGATGRNPEFMIPNIIRDQLDAGISSKYGYVPFVDYISGLRSMIANDNIYKKWQSSGAKIDLGELGGKKSISKLFDEKTAKKGLFNWLGEGLDWMGKYSEQPTRVGLFKKAYKKTGNELIAALESRDATVDFARMGSKMKVANSIVPFLNVGVQGFDKLIRSVKNNPGKVALNMALYGASPAIATTVYNLQNFPEEYSEIPQYEKDDNFVIVTGRSDDGNVQYLKFPKGNILPVVSNPIENFLSFAYGQDNQSVGELSLKLFGDLLPVVEGGGSANEILTKTIGSNIPQAIKPLAENLLNKSFYKYDPNKEQAKEIVPSYIQKREPYQQYYEWTPKTYQKLGALLNVSPLKVQNLAEGYLAGYAKLPSMIIDALAKTSRGEELTPNEKPLIRRFFGETYPSSAKPAEKTPTTPLMERITGKVSASESMPISEAKIESAKWKLRNSTDNSLKLSDTFYLVKSGDEINKIDISEEIIEPKYTGVDSIDKKLKSAYKGDLTKRGNDIVKLYENGLINLEQATALMDEIEIKYDATKGAKKPKKITLKSVKVSLPGISKLQKRTAPTVSIKSPTIKVSKPKKVSSIKISKGKTPSRKVRLSKSRLYVR